MVMPAVKNVAPTKPRRDTGEMIVRGKTGRAISSKDYVKAAGALLAKYQQEADELGRNFEMVIKVRPFAQPTIETRDDVAETAMDRARARGAKRVAEILKSPDMLNGREFGELVGASHETVNKWRKRGDVLALTGAVQKLRYPKWQVTEDGRLLPGLRELSAELVHPWAIYRFLLQPHPEMKGKTGLEALKDGMLKDVLETVRGIKRGNFS